MVKEFTKNLGDEVWVMYDNKPTKGSIIKMGYLKSLDCMDFESINENEQYEIHTFCGNIGSFSKNNIFDTKEDLIKSL